MLSIFRNKFFIISLILTILKQVLIAISTYEIGYIAQQLYVTSKLDIWNIFIFFMLILLSYIPNIFAKYFCIKSCNSAWEEYCIKFFTKVKLITDLNYEQNKLTSNAWISSEVFKSLEDSMNNVKTFIEMILSILFNCLAIAFILNWQFALFIMVSLFLGSAFVFVSNKYIKNTADNMQKSRNKVITNLGSMWDIIFCGNTKLRFKAEKNMSLINRVYFNAIETYCIVEESLAILPIMLELITITIIAILLLNSSSIIIVGSFISILPKTLHMFQYTNSLALCCSRMLLLRRKMYNIQHFIENLNKKNMLDLIKWDQLVINDNIEKSSAQFFNQIINREIAKGRYTIHGSNDSGKHILLKQIKKHLNEAILITSSGYYLCKDILKCNISEEEYSYLKNILSLEPECLLLDEWDKDLNYKNKVEIDKLINQYALSNLVIEILHSKSKLDII